VLLHTTFTDTDGMGRSLPLTLEVAWFSGLKISRKKFWNEEYTSTRSSLFPLASGSGQSPQDKGEIETDPALEANERGLIFGLASFPSSLETALTRLLGMRAVIRGEK
jgi:hypothetical protein